MPASIASVGMSSTAVRHRANHSRSAGLHGARANPQFPMTTLVTPCQHEQLPIGSQATCASMWVWPSIKPGALSDPSLELFSGNARLAANDDWSGSAEIIALAASAGAFALPTGSKDAAILVTLQPGSYT